MNEEERVIIAKAISKAREAYEKCFDDEGYETGNYPMNITVFRLDINFEETLHKIMDIEHKEKYFESGE